MAEIEIGSSRIGIDREHARERGGCLLELALIAEQHTELEMHPGVTRADAERHMASRDCVVGLALLAQHGRQVAMGFREIGLDRNGLAERANRLVEAALLLQDGAEIGKQAGVPTVSRYSPVEHFGRRVVPARMMAEQTEQMQSVQVTGLARQHFAITCFSFGEATGPVMRETAIKRLRRLGIVCGTGTRSISSMLKTVHHAPRLRSSAPALAWRNVRSERPEQGSR